jgi:hypothetical protein
VTIGKRVLEALQKAEGGDFEASLIPLCIAIDATAKKEHPNFVVGKRYKEFLRNNAWIIGYVSFRIVAKEVRLGLAHPKLRPGPDGLVLFEDILYHVVRCGLLHEGTFSDYVELSPTIHYGYNPPRLVIGQGIVWGLLFATVLPPVNAAESIASDAWLSVDGQRATVNELWGRRNSFVPALAQRALSGA